MPSDTDRLGLAVLTAVAVAVGIGPWLLPVAVTLASRSQPLPLDLSSQVGISSGANLVLLLVHAIVYVAVISLVALGLVLQKRHGVSGAQQVVRRTLHSVPWSRRTLRMAAISSTLAFAVALYILAARWRAG